ncbi:MAG TPA: GNAT family N-acetyltransferase, partial [Gemmatimonadales bacterium]|nr:GNAT family N-acetyltransferase [Gemmatimonadales bacterium]
MRRPARLPFFVDVFPDLDLTGGGLGPPGSEPMDIRRAEPPDLESLVPLFEGYRQFYGRAPDPPQARAFLADRLAAGDSVILLASDPGGALGFTQLYPLYSSVRCRRLWLLNDLYVAPAARGRGVARGLLLAARA